MPLVMRHAHGSSATFRVLGHVVSRRVDCPWAQQPYGLGHASLVMRSDAHIPATLWSSICASVSHVGRPWPSNPGSGHAHVGSCV
jgi:hypothetical protein